MDGLNSLSILENDIQSLAQKVYTGKELDRVSAFYNEHCEAVEKELKVLQILKEKKVDIKFISTLIHKATEVWKVELKSAIMEFTIRYNVGKNIPLTIEEMQQIVEWLKEKE